MQRQGVFLHREKRKHWKRNYQLHKKTPRVYQILNGKQANANKNEVFDIKGMKGNKATHLTGGPDLRFRIEA